ncbi:MAG: hypothetical protein JNL05_03990 [Flavobacteriales bacterium]|nr:hypothetical protein [Flavobacteriales bacterium]
MIQPMKTITTIAFLAIATLAGAQDKGTTMSSQALSKHQTDELSKSLSLTEEQKVKLNGILEQATKQAEPLREQCRAIDEKINTMYESSLAQWVSSLTPEQQKAYQEGRKSGTIDFTSCGPAGACAPGASKSGCSGDTRSTGQDRSINGAAKGCCAAGAHGEAKPADTDKKQPEKK